MKRAAWLITGALVLLALLSAWFFGLDGRHAVILVGAALAAGVANGLLDAVHLPRPALPAFPEVPRGLGDLQALEFSLSSTEPGTRAALELRSVATALVSARPDAARSTALEALVHRTSAGALSHREIDTLLDELEQLARNPSTEQSPHHRPGHRPQYPQETE